MGIKYREGDKVEVIDQTSEFYKKKGYVLSSKINDKTWVAFRPAKSSGNGFGLGQVKLIKSSIRGKEVEPSGCCVSSGGGVSARVLLEDCPIKREIGQYEDFAGMNFKEKIKVCTCVESSWRVPTCDNYKGLKEVTRGGRRVWRVSCDAVREGVS